MAKKQTKVEDEKLAKNKIEWSKIFASIVAGTVGIYGMWCGYKYYTLCKLAIENDTSMPDSALAVVCVSIVLASLLSYCLYQFGLKNSRNKYGIDSEGQPFRIPTDYTDDDLSEIVVSKTTRKK